MNMMKFIREKKEQIKESAKKRSLQKDIERNEAMKDLVKQAEQLKAEKEYRELKKAVFKEKHPLLHNLAKKISTNVNEKNNQLDVKAPALSSSNTNVFGQRLTPFTLKDKKD